MMGAVQARCYRGRPVHTYKKIKVTKECTKTISVHEDKQQSSEGQFCSENQKPNQIKTSPWRLESPTPTKRTREGQNSNPDPRKVCFAAILNPTLPRLHNKPVAFRDCGTEIPDGSGKRHPETPGPGKFRRNQNPRCYLAEQHSPQETRHRIHPKSKGKKKRRKFREENQTARRERGIPRPHLCGGGGWIPAPARTDGAPRPAPPPPHEHPMRSARARGAAVWGDRNARTRGRNRTGEVSQGQGREREFVGLSGVYPYKTRNFLREAPLPPRLLRFD